MPLQNRVTPEGQIIADPCRGTMMGNRGILHGTDRQLGPARWRHKAWICCLLAFRGRHRAVMSPNRYTELFFLDEAVALAAGHRPCAECRRAAFNAFRQALSPARPLTAPEIDTMLHPSRVGPSRRQVTFQADLAALPDGAFVLWNAAPALVWQDRLLPYAPDGYGEAVERPSKGVARVLTPKPSLAALDGGYRPALHTSANCAPAER